MARGFKLGLVVVPKSANNGDKLKKNTKKKNLKFF